MTKAEQNALLEYLEHRLVEMVEQTEIQLKANDIEYDPRVITTMYDNAYEVLNEMERSLADVEDLMVSHPKTKS